MQSPDSRKVKILLLGYDDNRLNGHVLSHYQKIPDSRFDKRMVVLYSLEGKKDYAFRARPTNVWGRTWSNIGKGLTRLKNMLQYHTIILVNKKKPEYHFYGIDKRCDVTAYEILGKNPDFVPDVIALYWTSIFINSKIIRDLYDLTKAVILFVFVDQAYLTGGCHYPNDCKGYMNGCLNCPALSIGKRVAKRQMADKLKYWGNMPKIVYGVKSDCQMAMEAPLFKDAFFIPMIDVPEVPWTEYDNARHLWNIDENKFVILLGANNIDSPRKGVQYAISAINKVAESNNNLCLLLLGKKDENIVRKLNIRDNVKIIAPGFLSLEDLIMAFCASDCHISPSIADSGPMMVNYSIASGTPVIAFNIGVARDIVLHKETGYIAKYKDSDDISNGIDWLMHMDTEAKFVMRKRCRALMEYQRTTQRPYYDEVYDYIVKNGR